MDSSNSLQPFSTQVMDYVQLVRRKVADIEAQSINFLHNNRVHFAVAGKTTGELQADAYERCRALFSSHIGCCTFQQIREDVLRDAVDRLMRGCVDADYPCQKLNELNANMVRLPDAMITKDFTGRLRRLQDVKFHAAVCATRGNRFMLGLFRSGKHLADAAVDPNVAAIDVDESPSTQPRGRGIRQYFEAARAAKRADVSAVATAQACSVDEGAVYDLAVELSAEWAPAPAAQGTTIQDMEEWCRRKRPLVSKTVRDILLRKACDSQGVHLVKHANKRFRTQSGEVRYVRKVWTCKPRVYMVSDDLSTA